MSNKLVKNYSIQHRALKLRIYPTDEQIVLINKTFGCCRQIYNTRLAERNEFYNNIIKPEIDKETLENCSLLNRSRTQTNL